MKVFLVELIIRLFNHAVEVLRYHLSGFKKSHLILSSLSFLYSHCQMIGNIGDLANQLVETEEF